MSKPELSVQQTMKRYPCIVSHVISESLGYATPSCAARILKDAREGRENYCEWIYSCYNKRQHEAANRAIKNRYSHHGFTAEYKISRALVDRAVKEGKEPIFASWF